VAASRARIVAAADESVGGWCVTCMTGLSRAWSCRS
jgi:hypothetical protein